MDNERLYNQWIGNRRKTMVPDGFAQRITETIAQRAPDQGIFPIVYRSLTHRLMDWAAGFALVLLGIFRLLYVTANLLMGGAL